MSWFKVDDQAAFHPKVVRAGNAAYGAWVRMGCYCNSHLTDGKVDEKTARLLATKKELDALIDTGLLHEIDGGYEIHDYLEYQPSRAHVTADRERTNARVKRHRNGVTGCFVTPAVTPAVTTAPIPIPIPIREELPLPPREGDGEWLRKTWAERTGIQQAPPLDYQAVAEALAEYGKATGESDVKELLKRALAAFVDEISSWSNKRSATPALFLRKWPEIQGRMREKTEPVRDEWSHLKRLT